MCLVVGKYWKDKRRKGMSSVACTDRRDSKLMSPDLLMYVFVVTGERDDARLVRRGS